MSPNGTRVAYARSRLRNGEIVKINVNNRKRTQITDNEVFDGDPTWSPDGTRIAFVRGEIIREPCCGSFLGKTDIFAIKADGTGETVNLTNTPNEDEFAPAWSPNGKEIAFHIDTQSSMLITDIFVLNLDTGQRRNLTNDGIAYRDYSPSWSPDGARIVFQSDSFLDGCWVLNYISTINASDGSDKRLLAQARHDTCFGDGSRFVGTTYSPNGRKIAYVQTNTDTNRIINSIVYTINDSEDSNKQRIYATDKEKEIALSSPDWGVKVRR
jgi:Tol biopolymer transport system component